MAQPRRVDRVCTGEGLIRLRAATPGRVAVLGTGGIPRAKCNHGGSSANICDFGIDDAEGVEAAGRSAGLRLDEAGVDTTITGQEKCLGGVDEIQDWSMASARDDHASRGRSVIGCSAEAVCSDSSAIVSILGAAESSAAGGQRPDEKKVGPVGCCRRYATKSRIVPDVGAGQGIGGERAGLQQGFAASNLRTGLRVAGHEEGMARRNTV